MWIRSQDKYLLININYVSVDENNRIWGDSACLGEYSTEEKAKKVLDEIQDAIEDTGFYRIDNIGHGTYAFSKGVQVYQMPQDDEVEV